MTLQIPQIIGTIASIAVVLIAEIVIIPRSDPFNFKSVRLFERWKYSHLIALNLCSYFPYLIFHI